MLFIKVPVHLLGRPAAPVSFMDMQAATATVVAQVRLQQHLERRSRPLPHPVLRDQGVVDGPSHGVHVVSPGNHGERVGVGVRPPGRCCLSRRGPSCYSWPRKVRVGSQRRRW